MLPFAELFGQLAVVWAFTVHTWWLWLPLLLFFTVRKLWKIYLRSRYFSALQWVLLEVKIPRDIAKTPEAMEQVFAGLQTMYWDFDFWEIWWEGLQHDYMVFEIASMGGETRFYIRTPVFFRNVVESLIYGQYPECEIAEAQDYIARLPDDVPNDEWDIFGVEFKLEKPDAYPIRTYRDIQSLTAGAEEFEKVDPLAAMLELLSRLRPGEHLGFHLLFKPAQTGGTDKWRKDGEALVAKLIGKKEAPKKSRIAKELEALEPVYTGWGEPLRPLFGLGPTEAAAPAKKEEPFGSSMMLHLSPGTREVVAAIERNILKTGFETVVRMCYVARREAFNMSHVSGFIGSLKTFNTQTLNAFKFTGTTMASKTGWWLPNFIGRRKKFHKKRLYYSYYRIRKPFIDTWSLKSQPVVLNTEELATIYHYPGRTAKAPLLPRIEARRSEPPATLPVS